MADIIPWPGADSSWRERLEKAGEHERDTHNAHRLALEARNTLVHEAVDNGFPQNYVAKCIKISAPSVTRILSQPTYGMRAA